MKSKKLTNVLWRVSFVNRITLQITPSFLCVAKTQKIAISRFRPYLIESLYDVESCTIVRDTHYLAMVAVDNYQPLILF